MKKFLFISFLILFITPYNIYSQIEIEGRVANNKNVGLRDVMVTIRSAKSSSDYAYTFSDSTGYFVLNYTGKGDSVIVSVSGFNIESKSIKASYKDQQLNFRVDEEALALREVTIKSNKIWGEKDTVNYLVSSFMSNGDYNIRDVLKKMPGVDVKESGEILYNGKPISKFYIENLDLLRGRYAVATNNIQANKISTVQILENHQPIKALDGKNIVSATAINLKLKDSAKGALNLAAQLGTGFSPTLWENELNLMYFSKTNQNISSYKGNNSGVNLSEELNSFTENSLVDENVISRLRMPDAPDIKKKRYTFNNSNSIIINNLTKLSKERQLTVNIVYLNQHDNKDSSSNSSYFFTSDSIVHISENTHIGQNTDELDINLNINTNKQDYYFDNTIRVNSTWNKGIGHIQINPNEITQRLRIPKLDISNTLNLVKTKNGKEFRVYSHNQLSKSNQSLIIRPGLYEDYWGAINDYQSLRQDILNNTFRSENRITILSYTKNYCKFNIDGEMNIRYHNLKSDIELYSDLPHSSDTLFSDLERFQIDAKTSPSFLYFKQKVNLQFAVPIQYTYLNLDYFNHMPAKSRHYVFLSPFIGFQYKMSAKTQIDLQYNYSNRVGRTEEMISGLILKDYRSIIKSEGIIGRYNSHQIYTTAKYKNILNMFFGSIDFSLTSLKQNILQDQEFFNSLNVSTINRYPNRINQAVFSTHINKGFDFLTSKIGLKYSTGIADGKQKIENKIYKYKNNIQVVEANISMNPINWLSINSLNSISWTKNKIDTESVFSRVRTIHNTIQFTFSLSKNILLKIEGDHYLNNIIRSGRRSKYFADTSLEYKIKKVNISLDWDNIFNESKYVSILTDNTNSFYYSYNIRPVCLLLKVKFNIL